MNATGRPTAEVGDRLAAGLSFLAREQRASGELPTFKARDAAITDDPQYDSTPFATTYVLHALSHVELPGVRALVERGLDFLESEMEPHGVWRYWTSSHPRHQMIPPDLDDTCCASAVLLRFGRRVLPNRELVLANRNRRGVFYTWFVPRPPHGRPPRAYWKVALHQALTKARVSFWVFTDAKPSDVDCVVNANVLNYLGDGPEASPVVELLRQALEEGREGRCDKWHRNACAFYYAVSRAYAGGVSAIEPLRELLAASIERTLRELEERSPAELALALCASLDLGRRPPALDVVLSRLLGAQQDDGSWAAFGLYRGGPYWWGSRALTTSLCLEAIARGLGSPQRRRAITSP